MNTYIFFILFAVSAICLMNTYLIMRILRFLNSSETVPSPLPISGNTLPSLEIPILDGSIFSSDVYTNKNILLVFIKPYCLPCVETIHIIQKVKPFLENITVFYVSLGMRDDTYSFAETEHLDSSTILLGLESPTLISYCNPNKHSPFYCYLNQDHVLISANFIAINQFEEIVLYWDQNPQVFS